MSPGTPVVQVLHDVALRDQAAFEIDLELVEGRPVGEAVHGAPAARSEHAKMDARRHLVQFDAHRMVVSRQQSRRLPVGCMRHVVRWIYRKGRLRLHPRCVTPRARFAVDKVEVAAPLITESHRGITRDRAYPN